MKGSVTTKQLMKFQWLDAVWSRQAYTMDRHCLTACDNSLTSPNSDAALGTHPPAHVKETAPTPPSLGGKMGTRGVRRCQLFLIWNMAVYAQCLHHCECLTSGKLHHCTRDPPTHPRQRNSSNTNDHHQARKEREQQGHGSCSLGLSRSTSKQVIHTSQHGLKVVSY